MNSAHWRLTGEQYEFIKGEVVHIFLKYRIKCIPVSGFEIATKMKITLIAYSSLSTKKLRAAIGVSKDGFVVESDGKYFIYFNDIDRSYERQNWTILHEIGHIVLDHTGYGANEEFEADFFAKYAIAPPILINKIGAKCPWDVHERFDISLRAAVYAYEYYLTWKARRDRGARLADYERKLLILSIRTA